MFVCIEIMTIFDAEKTPWQNARHVLGHILYKPQYKPQNQTL